MSDGGAIIIGVDKPVDANQLVDEVSVHLYDFKNHLNSYLQALGPKAPIQSLEAIIQSGRFHPDIEANIPSAAALDFDDTYRQRLLAQMKVRQQVMKLMADNKLDMLMYPHQKRLVVPIGKLRSNVTGCSVRLLVFRQSLYREDFHDQIPKHLAVCLLALSFLAGRGLTGFISGGLCPGAGSSHPTAAIMHTTP